MSRSECRVLWLLVLGLVLGAVFGVSGASAAQFLLSWDDNSDNEAGFRIERRQGTGAWAEIVTLPANATSYIDSGLPNSTAYSYRLRAYNAAGVSAYSNTVTGTTPAALTLPAVPGLGALGGIGTMSNISTRGTVTAAEPLIGGFTVVGGKVRVLIRGVGPGLTQLGVATALADVRFVLFSGSTQIAQVDDWTGDTVAAAAALVGAFPLPVGSKDAAALYDLEPGSYTVHVVGAGTSAPNSGVALVECYQIAQ